MRLGECRDGDEEKGEFECVSHRAGFKMNRRVNRFA
jgi:hypothetical protein